MFAFCFVVGGFLLSENITNIIFCNCFWNLYLFSMLNILQNVWPAKRWCLKWFYSVNKLTLLLTSSLLDISVSVYNYDGITLPWEFTSIKYRLTSIQCTCIYKWEKYLDLQRMCVAIYSSMWIFKADIFSGKLFFIMLLIFLRTDFNCVTKS